MHHSVATIDAPEFINLQPLDINPLMSSCQIKVMYIGKNRNKSFISKEVAMEMAKTLRGAPIVGYYKKDKQDFGDHGQKMIIDDEGIKFECQTVPYGFVAPDADVWFKKFEDFDEFGNSVVHEYLMTNGYLWTEQFQECKRAVECGNPQSMELDEKTLQGEWSKDYKSEIEFFIINDAIFSKLCILGEDVEPCFEGASVTASKYSLDDNFNKTLFSMIQDMKKFALKGGQQQMDEIKNTGVDFTEDIETVIEEVEEITVENEAIEEVVETTEEIVETEELPEENFEKKEEEEEKEEDEETSEEESDEEEPEAKHSLEEEVVEEQESVVEEQEVVEDFEQKYQLLKEQFESLQSQYNELKEANSALSEFKLSIDNENKDKLIAKFYMLSDEDKADVIENKVKYTLEEIESKLAVICFRKKINFSLNEEKEKQPQITYNVDVNNEESVPDIVAALRNTRNNK